MRRCCRRYNCTVINFSFILLLIFLQIKHHRRSKHAYTEQLKAYLRTCAVHVSPIATESGKMSVFSDPLQEMLSEIDHIFIVSVESCRTKLPPTLSQAGTCVIGRQVDSCAPKRFLTNPLQHAMRVTFTHAVVLQLALDAGYRHVIIVEDDIVIRESLVLSTMAVNGFKKLVSTNSWSMIRFGYRPYFLQENGVEKCPSSCRCDIQQAFSEHLCKLRHSGCDLRSSDFYIVHSAYYEPLQKRMLDVRQTNENRIIDTLPMRSIPHQWLLIPQVSVQSVLDIPPAYQLGLGALYVTKCVGPRPIPSHLLPQVY